MTPNEMYRLMANLEHRAKLNQLFFSNIDYTEYGKGALVGNANYVVQQAKDLYETEKMAGDDAALSAHARSDISRILAILHRQCQLRGIDFLAALSEGVEYEEAVVKDIQEGRREARSHKGLNSEESLSTGTTADEFSYKQHDVLKAYCTCGDCEPVAGFSTNGPMQRLEQMDD